MPLAHENIAPRTNGGQESFGAAEPCEALVLPKDAPLDAAKRFLTDRYTRADDRLLHYHRGAFYSWTETHYRELRPETLQAELYQFLAPAVAVTKKGETEPFNPNRAKISAIEHALQRLVLIDARVDMPCWLGQDHAPAKDVVVVQNGILNLRTRTLTEHSPFLFTTTCLPCDYSASAKCPLFDKFLGELWAEDREARNILQEIFGYLLTPDTSQQRIFLIIGPKRAGKGTLVHLLRELLGANNVTFQRLASLAGEFGRWPLIDKSLAVVADARLKTTDTHRLTETLLSISGGDPQTINRKYASFWSGRLNVRFLITTNVLPVLADASGTIASRFIVLRLTESFYGKEDRELASKLTKELSGILNWSLAGLERLERRGYFLQPASGAEHVQRMADLAAPIATFAREWCEVGPAKSIKVKELCRAYLAWSKETGQKPQPAFLFGKELHDACPTLATKGHGARRTYVGIGLSATGSQLLDEALRVETVG
jgi:putative DNA primase/helicase